MEFFTPNEISRILKLHPFTVTRLARERKIPGFKVGGSWRFRKDEFERWATQRGPKNRSRNVVKSSQIQEYHIKKPTKDGQRGAR